MKKQIYLDEKGNQVRTKLIISQHGSDDQDYEEVLLSDSERFPTGEIINSPIY